MTQSRASQRGVTNLVSCGILIVMSVFGAVAGCSAQNPQGERLGENAEAASLCNCPPDNPCATFSCVLSTCKATVLIKEGEKCGADRTSTGVCHLNLCCPGCVIPGGKGSPPTCSTRGGTASTECGETGTTCTDCTSDPCVQGTCSSRQCAYTPVPEKGACIGRAGGCHNGSCCSGCVDKDGACRGGNELGACGVSNGGLADCNDCTDSNTCTGEICQSGSCQYPAVPPDTSCADTDVCNGTEGCSGTECKSGTPLDCADAFECTTDSCDATDGCKHAPRPGETCSDGDPCTKGDTCGDGTACQPGAQINCADSEPICTADACQGGNCVNTPVANDTPCDDGDPCTSNDKCNAGKCKGTSANGVDCNDNKACTIDSQVACNSTDCNHAIAPATTSCIADKCHGAGHCSGTDETCVPGEAIDCDDKNPCTTDGCDPQTGCTHVNDPAADCSDSDACTENDVCVAGVCGGKPKKCLALDACHEPGTCNPLSGACDDPRSPDKKPCPGGACESGKCVLDPTLGLGGDGGGGPGEAGAGGETSAAGAGAGAAPSEGGEGGAPSGNGGAPGGGSSGSSGHAGTTQGPGQAGDGETPAEPDRPFRREPGGCSCELPGSESGRGRALGLTVLGFALLTLRRRSRREPKAA